MRVRRGTSLVEVMIALTIVAVGLLALAAATALLARQRRDARLAVAAAALAARRAAATAACLPEPSLGERDAGPLRERWATRDDAGLAVATTTVARPGAGRAWTFVARGACGAP